MKRYKGFVTVLIPSGAVTSTVVLVISSGISGSPAGTCPAQSQYGIRRFLAASSHSGPSTVYRCASSVATSTMACCHVTFWLVSSIFTKRATSLPRIARRTVGAMLGTRPIRECNSHQRVYPTAGYDSQSCPTAQRAPHGCCPKQPTRTCLHTVSGRGRLWMHQYSVYDIR